MKVRSRFVAGVVLIFLWTMATHGKPSSSGDEPYYLIVAQSLLADGDLDLANNFRQDDGRLVGATGLQPGSHARIGPRGELRSVHDLGLSVLVLPAFLVGRHVEEMIPATALARFRMTEGRFAYFTVSIFLICMTALGAALLHRTLSGFASTQAAAVLAILVTLTPPILSHGFLIFPETPAYFVTCAVLLVGFRRQESYPAFLALATLLGTTPWIHRKFSFFVIGLAFCVWSRHRNWFSEQGLQRRVLLGLLFVAPQIAFHLFTISVWGNLGGPQLQGSLPFSIAGLGTGAVGLLLDRSRGLLPYAPIYFLLPVAWWVSGRRFRIWLIPAAALFLPLAAYDAWDAGYSPAARFLVPLMPLLILPAATMATTRWFRIVAIPFIALQLFMVGYCWNRPRALWPGEIGDNRALSAVPTIGPTLNKLFPVISQGAWK